MDKIKQYLQEYNNIFFQIVKRYDINNTNIQRKIMHVFEVANRCFAIACKFKCKREYVNLCYLIGLFHDIGRFEQWKLYQTYNDKESVNHGELSGQILKDEIVDQLDISQREKEILIFAVSHHTVPVVTQDKELKFFDAVIKNADAFANVITSAAGIQQMTVDKTGYNKLVYDDFVNMKPLNKYNIQTRLERCFSVMANCYNVEFDFLREEIVKYGYIDIIYDRFSVYLDKKEAKIFYDAVQKIKAKYIIKTKKGD